MTDRIDKYLDGSLDRSALTPDERLQADIVAQVIEETRAFVDAGPAPDLTTAVMSRIADSSAHGRTADRGPAVRLWQALWGFREVSFRFRPAWGLLGTVLLVTFLVATRAPVPEPGPEIRATAESPGILVQFRLPAPDAMNVRLAGTFTGWQPQYELHQSAPGVWTVTVALPAGVHDYAFVVDGQRWVPDPYAQAVDDGFGGTNSRIALLPLNEPNL